MRRIALFPVIALLFASAVVAQSLTLPPNGDNQKSAVIQYVGPVELRIDYNSPDVHSPTGEDRRGKIWGELVPYGLTNLGFGPCKECPWRAGANENTVFTTSHDVLVNGQKLPAGSYGLHMIADPKEWTIIFSKNNSSWGSFFYDPKEDALRVKATPVKAEYNEWLTFEFTDRQTDKATVAMKWEDLAVPFTVTVPDVSELYLAKIRNELRNSQGFTWQNWAAAARYALDNKHPDEALQWAQSAVNAPFVGKANFQTLSMLAQAQQAKGMTAEAKATWEKALNDPTASAIDLHQYARQALTTDKDEAIRVWKLNAKRYPNAWPVNVGLMRAYSASGDYKQALKYAKLALSQAPDELNRKSLEDAVKKLGEGKDVN